MKIKRSSPRKKLVLATIIGVVLIGSVAAWAITKRDGATTPSSASNTDGINYSPPTQDEIKDGQQAKVNSADNEASKPSTENDNTGNSLPPSQTGVTITAANQNGQTLQVRTLIEKITSSGTCTLTLTKASQTVTKTASVQALASSSTCQGFDVPVSELSTGTWTVVVSFSGSGVQGSATKQVAIQ